MGSIYTMQKRTDGWVISVGSNELLTCSRRATAMRVIRHAAFGLDFVEYAIAATFGECPGEDSCPDDPGGDPADIGYG